MVVQIQLWPSGKKKGSCRTMLSEWLDGPFPPTLPPFHVALPNIWTFGYVLRHTSGWDSIQYCGVPWRESQKQRENLSHRWAGQMICWSGDGRNGWRGFMAPHDSAWMNLLCHVSNVYKMVSIPQAARGEHLIYRVCLPQVVRASKRRDDYEPDTAHFKWWLTDLQIFHNLTYRSQNVENAGAGEKESFVIPAMNMVNHFPVTSWFVLCTCIYENNNSEHVLAKCAETREQWNYLQMW